MISRRNIRVKVMQTLYTLSCMEHVGEEQVKLAGRVLNDKLEHVLDIFTVSVLYCVRIAQFAETDAAQRSARLLALEEDKNIRTYIADNALVRKIATNTSFIEKVKNNKLERFVDTDWVRKVFQSLSRTDEYQAYNEQAQHSPAQDKEIIRFIWEKQILENEGLVSFFNDELPGWEDDQELIVMLMQNFFTGNGKINFSDLLSSEKKEYAHDLLLCVLEKDEYCMSLITPRLTNWDKDRVALIDMLLLKMGVCEFLFFPTIPTKVTINEYIDVAKQYSTPQSGQFVNGVLDNILKDLVKDGKVQKQDRGTR